MSTTDQLLEAIDAKLDISLRLLGALCVQGKNQTEAIQALAALGLQRGLIAHIVDASPQTVSSRLHEQRKRGGAAGTRRKGKSTAG